MPLAAETLEQFDKKLETELRAMDPAAVAIWLNANAARAANRHQEAVRLYAEVYKRVPTFVHALRRQAGEEMELGQRVQAYEHARQALAQDRSAENLATAAFILISAETARTEKELTDTRSPAGAVVTQGPRDAFASAAL